MSGLREFFGSKVGFAVCLALALLGFYLLWTHTGHVLLALPYLFLLACPLLHLFGHGRHGHGPGGHGGRDSPTAGRSGRLHSWDRK
jgi:hypothetical protein